TGYSNVGGLVGKMDYGLLQDSSVVGIGVQSTTNYAGGLVGANESGAQIRSSYAKFTNGVIGGGDYIGGVVGYNNGLVYKSYVNLANVTGDESVGGVVGRNDAGLVQESYAKATVKVNGRTDIGGGIGYNVTGTVLSSYAEALLVTGTSDNIGGLVGRNVSGPITSSYAKVTTVSSTAGAKLGGLVGMNGTGLGKIENCYAETTNITGSAGDNVGGLVGFNTGGEIKNSYAKSSTAITGISSVGGFVGYNGSGYLSSSYAEVKGISASLDTVGGFVGFTNSDSYISKCYAKSSGTIQGTSYIGGFVGYAVAAQIVESYALPTTVTGSVDKTGGFVGWLVSSFFANVFVRSSQGTVTGITQVGGFVGNIDGGTIINSYAVWNSVAGTGVSIGGHTGVSANNSNIDNAFSVASVSGASSGNPPSVGLFIGTLPAAQPAPLIGEILKNVYADWNVIRTCVDTGTGLDVCNVNCENTSGGIECYNDRSLTTLLWPILPDTSSTYEVETDGTADHTNFYYKTNLPLASWDFTNVWKENTSDYPTLR
ncbi:MAG: GLUG motif-containing protein, partial [Bdellovibrionota bacterium]